jgi:DNA primase
MDKISYPETIKTLARKQGVAIVYEDGGAGEDGRDWEAENSHKDQLFELYRRTAITFQHFLLKTGEGRPAFQYIISRGISGEMIERFRLGYAPAGRGWLYGFLQKKGYSAEFLDNSGLFSTNYRGMAFFSGRLMFPIADRQGRIVAFSGRVLPGAVQSDGKEPPKYINSRELEIYKKGQTLFALDLAIPAVRQTKTVYLAEGNMDVIALHQAGITNAVAPLGTAFTDEQAKLLRRWAEKAVLVFDSDNAGQEAARKGILTCRKNGLSCALAVPGNPEGAGPHDPAAPKDPGEILQKFGAGILKKNMECCITDFEYLISRGRSLYDVSAPEGKNRALALLFPWLETLDSEIERDDCIAAAADVFGVSREAVHKDYNRHRTVSRAGDKSSPEEVANRQTAGLPEKPVRMTDELFLLTVVSVNAMLYPEFRASLEIKEIEDPAAKELFVALEECFIHEESGFDDLLSRISSDAVRNFIMERGTSPEFRGDEKRDPKRFMEDGIKRIKGKKLRSRSSEIGAELRMRERNPGMANGNSLEDLLAEKMSIDSELRKLEGK